MILYYSGKNLKIVCLILGDNNHNLPKVAGTTTVALLSVISLKRKDFMNRFIKDFKKLTKDCRDKNNLNTTQFTVFIDYIAVQFSLEKIPYNK